MIWEIRLQQYPDGGCQAQAAIMSKGKPQRERVTARGDCLLDALARVCRMPRLQLTCEDDELDLCRAMARGKSILCQATGPARLQVLSLHT